MGYTTGTITLFEDLTVEEYERQKTMTVHSYSDICAALAEYNQAASAYNKTHQDGWEFAASVSQYGTEMICWEAYLDEQYQGLLAELYKSIDLPAVSFRRTKSPDYYPASTLKKAAATYRSAQRKLGKLLNAAIDYRVKAA